MYFGTHKMRLFQLSMNHLPNIWNVFTLQSTSSRRNQILNRQSRSIPTERQNNWCSFFKYGWKPFKWSLANCSAGTNLQFYRWSIDLGKLLSKVQTLIYTEIGFPMYHRFLFIKMARIETYICSDNLDPWVLSNLRSVKLILVRLTCFLKENIYIPLRKLFFMV